MGKKKTHEEFMKELEEKWPGKYIVLGTYVNNATKIKIKCNKCGYEWDVTPNNLLRGRMCPVCSINHKKELYSMTQEEFERRLEAVHPGAWAVLGTYINNQTPIRVKCTSCGIEKDVFPGNILRNKGLCSCKTRGSKITMEDFKREYHDKFPESNLSFGGEFYNKATKITATCDGCGYVWNIAPTTLLRGVGCPKCAIEKAKRRNMKTNEDFRKEVEDSVGSEYEVLDDYKGAFVALRFKHKECGTIFSMTPHAFLSGHRCHICSGGVKYSHDDFTRKIKELVGDEYAVLGEYVNSKTKIKMKHNVCGHAFMVTPEHFISGGCTLQGTRCPYCPKSKGEKVIKTVLDEWKLEYKQEFSFDDCKNIRRLRFDFAILSESKILGLIEYDGKQHYKPIDYWGGNEFFKVAQERDSIKNNYCKEHDIPLLRVPYTCTEKEVKDFVAEFLRQIGAVG